MKVLITLTLTELIDDNTFKAEYRHELCTGYELIIRVHGAAMIDRAISWMHEKVLVYGSLWNRTKDTQAWIEVDCIMPSYEHSKYFAVIGRVFKSPIQVRDRCKFPIVVSRTIADKHYYSMSAVGNAAKLVQASVSERQLVYLEGFIELIQWVDNLSGELKNSLKFIVVSVRAY